MARSNIITALLPLLALSIAAAGCGSTVVGGGDDGSELGDGDDGASDDGASDDGASDDGASDDGNECCVGDYCCEPQPPTSFAYAETDGDNVRLVFSSGSLACGAEPWMPETCTGQEEFWLDVTMPVARLVPGTIYLDEPGIDSFGNSQGAARSDDSEDCWWGGGSGVGSLEILEATADSLRIRTIDALGTLDGPSQVDFDLARCGDATVVEPEPATNAIAFRLPMSDEGDDGEGDDDGGASGQTGGNGTDEDRFVVQIANHTAATCSDHYAMPECPYEARDISVSLPASRNFVGSVIDLSDETIFVGSTEQGGGEDGDCWWGGGAGPLPGTMTIVAAGQGTIDVTFAGTGDPLVEGTHTVTVCD